MGRRLPRGSELTRVIWQAAAAAAFLILVADASDVAKAWILANIVYVEGEPE